MSGIRLEYWPLVLYVRPASVVRLYSTNLTGRTSWVHRCLRCRLHSGRNSQTAFSRRVSWKSLGKLSCPIIQWELWMVWWRRKSLIPRRWSTGHVCYRLLGISLSGSELLLNHYHGDSWKEIEWYISRVEKLAKDEYLIDYHLFFLLWCDKISRIGQNWKSKFWRIITWK